MLYKIILEYYDDEILVYCPEIPCIHELYDIDIPLDNILQNVEKEILLKREIIYNKKISIEISI